MLETTETNERIQLRMSATLENVEAADDLLAAYLDARQVPVDLFAIRILLREGLCNAVIHGSGKDPDKIVRLEARTDSTSLTLTIEDSGPGFDWLGRAQPLDVVGDGGRGVPLMEIYADKVEFNEKGNVVSMRRNFIEAHASCGDTSSNSSEDKQ